jgi:hypothetical protein
MRRCEIDLEDEHNGFRLVQALSWSNSLTSSICCIMLSRLGFQMSCGLLLI